MHIPIMFRLAARYMARRRLQSVLFVLGVALGVAMVIAIDLANGSASRAFDLSAQSVTGRATHQITGTSQGIPTDVYRQLRLDVGLREAAPVIEQYVQAPALQNQTLRLLGVDPFAEPPFREYLNSIEVLGENQTAFESLNTFIVQPGTALISQTLADRAGIVPGDALIIVANAQEHPVMVIGLLRPADRTSAEALDNLLLTDIATAQELIGDAGRVTRIDLILPDGFDLARIESILPAGAQIASTRSASSALGQMTDAFELNLQALSLLALVVGVFLIYNTVTFSVVQRRPVLGILRSVGATKPQIFTLILGEAITLGVIGTVIGLALGIVFGRLAVGLVSQTISDLYFTVNVQRVTVDPFTLVKGALIGVAASIGAALVPSLDATRTPPAGSMRRSDLESSTRQLIPLITLAAGGLLAFGVLLLQLPTQSLIVSFGALFAVILGGALFTPLVLVAGMRLVTPLTERLFGLLGRMAPRAVARSLSRTSVAVAALTIAVSVIVGLSVMIGSFRNTVADWLDNTLGADIYVSPPLVNANRAEADVDPAVADAIRAQVDGIERLVTGRGVTINAPDYPDLPPVNLTAASDEVVSTGRDFVWFNTAIAPAYTPAALGSGDYLIVSEPFAFRRGITPENDTITLLTDRGAVAFTVIGVYTDYSTDQGTTIMDDAVYRRYFDDPYITSIALFLAPGADLETALEATRAAVAGTALIPQSNRTLRAGVFDVFERTFAITDALQLLSVVVAFIGILSALMALQLEQTRHYGVMRAVGLTGGQLRDYTLIQTGLMGITAGALAMPIGLALALILIDVINVRSFGWTMRLALPFEDFALAFAVAVVAALLAGVYPARVLSGLVTARALRAE
ncbi:MAG: FtsX-like permease family protein [bacterium]|nr:FtsX-like permease family protein [bacterium]